ncbi:MAG: sugar transferase [Candidatus Shapirobacteria bacterium]|nr:sugar transferase [Candidatus Shapirobacteria bacterium]MDD5074057.1 sugar transferase [Candidatus Shapirobacteria bacterium]MDD5481689.1 sugar transferase [Candidatus Shapirobacteria bacterium]
MTSEQVYYPAKRLSDILLSLIIGFLALPICLATTIAIKLDSKGPILADVPPRVGKNRQPFKIFKFRSMIPNAHQMIRQDPRLKKIFAELKKNNFKLKDDPRITRVGKFIRKYSIDELPQLINVLRGEMSFVGPRPYYADELAEYEKRFPQTKKLIQEALTVKPGITGLWQVSGRSDVNFEERITLDAKYAQRKNLVDDILIIAKSPWVVLTGKGAS